MDATFVLRALPGGIALAPGSVPMLPSREKLARELERRSDADLLALASREPEAFAVFYRRHYQAIVSYLTYYTGSVDVAADLAAEVFADALDGIARYAPEKGAARAWLFGIARNTLLSSYRRQGAERSARRKLGVSVDAFGEEIWDDVQSRLDANISGLVAGLDGLSPVERDAVIARVIDERDYAEIADATGSSEAAVRQRVSRGLSKLARRVRRSER